MINYTDKFSINGKTAFVTGGCGLIGKEICAALAQFGAEVVILDIDEVKGKAVLNSLLDSGLKCSFEYFDVTNLEKMECEIVRLADKYGRIDIWVNSAYPRTSDWGNRVEDLNLESWRMNVDMHLNSYSLISREVALSMKGSSGGNIINVASIYGLVGNDFTVYEGTNMTSPMAYAAIKGGIVNLTRYLASYFGKDGIRINSLCPGGIFDHQNPVFVENFSKKCPMKRMGLPEEIAGAVVFLSSEAASYVTGTSLVVDGGWTAI